ncbi:hypothetical protein HYH03_017632 [Edaphochlamys debaryana]|uniref:Uncharacterized protein n=1 Tax=Edaphochlamys debaryana TaxID=47281 RepID=A0A835XHL5_9CHLO|nr:hypothetical protein HYH03_017632 [Edaphochlamys debaryana]|eukprot:KAG2483525.1 hypothetical protein HYH03_017632 [Edaphochlamys debaryana]
MSGGGSSGDAAIERALAALLKVEAPPTVDDVLRQARQAHGSTVTFHDRCNRQLISMASANRYQYGDGGPVSPYAASRDPSHLALDLPDTITVKQAHRFGSVLGLVKDDAPPPLEVASQEGPDQDEGGAGSPGKNRWTVAPFPMRLNASALGAAGDDEPVQIAVQMPTAPRLPRALRERGRTGSVTGDVVRHGYDGYDGQEGEGEEELPSAALLAAARADAALAGSRDIRSRRRASACEAYSSSNSPRTYGPAFGGGGGGGPAEEVLPLTRHVGLVAGRLRASVSGGEGSMLPAPGPGPAPPASAAPAATAPPQRRRFSMSLLTPEPSGLAAAAAAAAAADGAAGAAAELLPLARPGSRASGRFDRSNLEALAASASGQIQIHGSAHGHVGHTTSERELMGSRGSARTLGAGPAVPGGMLLAPHQSPAEAGRALQLLSQISHRPLRAAPSGEQVWAYEEAPAGGGAGSRPSAPGLGSSASMARRPSFEWQGPGPGPSPRSSVNRRASQTDLYGAAGSTSGVMRASQAGLGGTPSGSNRRVSQTDLAWLSNLSSTNMRRSSQQDLSAGLGLIRRASQTAEGSGGSEGGPSEGGEAVDGPQGCAGGSGVLSGSGPRLMGPGSGSRGRVSGVGSGTGQGHASTDSAPHPARAELTADPAPAPAPRVSALGSERRLPSRLSSCSNLAAGPLVAGAASPHLATATRAPRPRRASIDETQLGAPPPGFPNFAPHPPPGAEPRTPSVAPHGSSSPPLDATGPARGGAAGAAHSPVHPAPEARPWSSGGGAGAGAGGVLAADPPQPPGGRGAPSPGGSASAAAAGAPAREDGALRRAFKHFMHK